MCIQILASCVHLTSGRRTGRSSFTDLTKVDDGVDFRLMVCKIKWSGGVRPHCWSGPKTSVFAAVQVLKRQDAPRSSTVLPTGA